MPPPTPGPKLIDDFALNEPAPNNLHLHLLDDHGVDVPWSDSPDGRDTTVEEHVGAVLSAPAAAYRQLEVEHQRLAEVHAQHHRDHPDLADSSELVGGVLVRTRRHVHLTATRGPMQGGHPGCEHDLETMFRVREDVPGVSATTPRGYVARCFDCGGVQVIEQHLPADG